ncbi:MAG: GNAT family N-acetyltransferase, partial [Acidimicrobiia bacterium]|nr:GNAT family N-acetyltransferase [Acidimicrobiia bacterium]
CLHWRLDTVSARSVVCLHDLYVSPEHRRKRVGDALLKAAAANAYLRGAEALVWTTAPDNTGAQALYDSAGATRSSWIEYELSLESPSKYLWQ